MTAYESVRSELRTKQLRWLVTGAAGFIGSHLVEQLLALGQEVVALDNLADADRRNFEEAVAASGVSSSRCRLLEADITDRAAMAEACRDADIVLHQAAQRSVPRSIDEPVATHSNNVDGFVNVLEASLHAGVKRLVYASSSSVYGDLTALPNVENRIGDALSPYAMTKRVNELYANLYQRLYGIEVVGLRYFNVFGKRQDPYGDYAAVIPKWVVQLVSDEPCVIFGDGETSRDFCYIDDVVQSNILSATADADATGHVYNVASGNRTSLNQLFAMIRSALARSRPEIAEVEPVYEDFRPGDMRHTYADIAKARRLLGYAPASTVAQGIEACVDSFAYLVGSDSAERTKYAGTAA